MNSADRLPIVFSDEQDIFRFMQKAQTDEKEKAERIRKKYVEEELQDRKKVRYRINCSHHLINL